MPLTCTRSKVNLDEEAIGVSMHRFADQHVELYVNAWTSDLGPLGQEALAALSRSARDAGLLPPEAPDLEVLGSG